MHHSSIFVFTLIGLLMVKEANCLLKRCFSCRSRGEMGTCRDPFPFNVTQADLEIGLNVVACSSGWCGKMMEGGNMFKGDDYGVATQRMCLQRGPSDYEERCAYTLWSHRKVYMCFCNGDMCNGSDGLKVFPGIILVSVMVTIFNILTRT